MTTTVLIGWSFYTPGKTLRKLRRMLGRAIKRKKHKERFHKHTLRRAIKEKKYKMLFKFNWYEDNN